MSWEKAKNFGTGKSGGGKLKSVATSGDRGLPPGVVTTKASVSRVKGGIDSPSTKGDKGTSFAKAGAPSHKAPLD